jgi:hypothetical protein
LFKFDDFSASGANQYVARRYMLTDGSDLRFKAFYRLFCQGKSANFFKVTPLEPPSDNQSIVASRNNLVTFACE